MRTLKLSDQTLDLETRFEDRFEKDSGQWLAEGTPKVAWRAGRLFIDAVSHERHFSTLWCRKRFEGDALIEYTWRVEPGAGRNNLNFFVYAEHAGGASVLDTSSERSGEYGEYHVFPNYIYTYLSGNREDADPENPQSKKTRVRFRKDPGFNLVREVWRDGLIEKGRDYRFAIAIQGPRMRFYVDEQLWLDHEDHDAPWRRGHHGYRTWKTHVSLALFRESRLARAE